MALGRSRRPRPDGCDKMRLRGGLLETAGPFLLADKEDAMITKTRTAAARHATKAQPSETLNEAVRRALATHWRGLRTATHMADMATLAMESFASMARKSPDVMTIGGLRPDHVARAVTSWLSDGLAPATINKRLVCAGVCGAPVKGQFVNNPKSVKWWLTPEAQQQAVQFCRAKGREEYTILADYIEWTVTTGLRLEETLRLLPRNITGWGNPREMSVSVPGLKTAKAQRTLPLTVEAAEVILRRAGPVRLAGTPLFPLQYDQMKALWAQVRKHIGEEGNPTCTLKALRRNAARHLHVDKGLPLDMVRQYLGHSDIGTTMEYLRLVGGYSEGEMRRYFGKQVDTGFEPD